jgi:hypothetical protein
VEASLAARVHLIQEASVPGYNTHILIGKPSPKEVPKVMEMQKADMLSTQDVCHVSMTSVWRNFSPVFQLIKSQVNPCSVQFVISRKAKSHSLEEQKIMRLERKK